LSGEIGDEEEADELLLLSLPLPLLLLLEAQSAIVKVLSFGWFDSGFWSSRALWQVSHLYETLLFKLPPTQ
jgi:hypothetical protein